MLSTVYLAAEDVPGLAAGRKLLAEHTVLSIYMEENARGYGTLKRKTPNYDQMSRHGVPVLMLTDLDGAPCPSGKITEWLGRTPGRGFLFRICVREIEAWLLADRSAMAAFLKIKEDKVPSAPEKLADPKAFLIKLAQAAPRKIRVGLTPLGRATIGPDYNELLARHIAESWSLDRAAAHAPSLKRARKRIAELAGFLSTQTSP
jgi:Domain of unknown function (DUF4276)